MIATKTRPRRPARKPRRKTKQTELSYVIGKGFHVTRDQGEALFGVIRKKFNGKKPSPDQLIAEAKKKRSPIHGLFEWDEKRAAERHWQGKARYYLRAIQIVEVRIDTRQVVRGPVRAFVPVQIEKDGRIPEENYVPVQRLSEKPENIDAVLRRAKADVQSVIARYKRYAEFMAVFGPMVKAFEKIEKLIK
jgi:hypothetical protein